MALPSGFVPDKGQTGALPAGFEPELNPDAVHVGAAPTAADIGVADANPTSAAPAPIRSDVGRGKAFARGAVAGGTLGLFSVLNSAADQAGQKLLPQAALDFIQQHGGGGEGLPINEPHTFAERRGAYQGLLDQAKEQHPGFYTAGEVAGTIAAPTPGAGALGGLAEKGVAKLGGKALAQGLVKAGVEGGVAGAEFGAGSALGEGATAEQVADAAKRGTLYGAVSGAALHGIAGLTGKVAEKAQKSLQDKYVQLFGSEVLGSASKKSTKESWGNIIGKDAADVAEIDQAKQYVKSKELAPVEAAAKHGNYDEAQTLINQRLQTMQPARTANYNAVNEAGEFEVGNGLAALDKEAFVQRNAKKNPQALKALERARQEWVADFSTADSGAVQRLLLRPTEETVSTATADELRKVVDSLPQDGRISRTQIAEAVKQANAGAEAIQYIAKHVTDDEKGLMSWDPKATIPAQEIRAEATKRQQSALLAFDALMPQFQTETKKVVKNAINGALEQYLDKFAAQSPAKAAIVNRIRTNDVKYSVLLTAREGLKQQAVKQSQKELQTQAGYRLHHPTALSVGIAAAQAARNQAARSSATGVLSGSINPLAQSLARRGLGNLGANLPQLIRSGQSQPPQPQPITGTTSFGTAGN